MATQQNQSSADRAANTDEIDRLAGIAAAKKDVLDVAEKAFAEAGAVRSNAFKDWNFAIERLHNAVEAFVLSKCSSGDGAAK